MRKFFWASMILGLALLIPFQARADISLTLELDRAEAVPGDSIRMVVSLSGVRESESDPVISGLENFIVNPGGRSSRIEIMNGNVTKGVDYTYFLQPKKVGTFQIGPARIKVDDRSVQSNHVSLVVKKASAQGDQSGDIFLKTELSKDNVFVEAQTIYTLRLFYRIRIRDVSLGLPENPELTFKQLGKPGEYQRTIGGQPYQVLEVRYALTASAAGEFPLEPARMVMQVVQRNRRSLFNNFFDDPFSSPSRPQTVVSEPLVLTVHPIPDAGRPADFSGLVGDFKLSSTLEPDHIKAGESATLTVQVTGVGNVNRIPDLKVPEPAQTKVYADQPTIQTENTEAGSGGTKIMKWAFVPEKPGIVEIQPLSVSFFDTGSGAYKKLETPAYSLSVEPGREPAPVVVQPSAPQQKAEETTAKNQIEELGQDILPIHTNIHRLAKSQSVFPKNGLIGLGLFGPFMIYLAGFFLTRLRKTTPESTAQSKARKACKILVRECRRNELCHQELIENIRLFINDRFRLSIGFLTSQEAARVLREKGVTPETTEKLQALIARIEHAIYTGQGQNRTDMAAEACQIAEAIEKEVR